MIARWWRREQGLAKPKLAGVCSRCEQPIYFVNTTTAAEPLVCVHCAMEEIDREIAEEKAQRTAAAIYAKRHQELVALAAGAILGSGSPYRGNMTTAKDAVHQANQVATEILGPKP